jgi:hypothetical protein
MGRECVPVNLHVCLCMLVGLSGGECLCNRSMAVRDVALKAKHEAMQSLVTEKHRTYYSGFDVSDEQRSPRTLEFVDMPAVHVYVFWRT